VQATSAGVVAPNAAAPRKSFLRVKWGIGWELSIAGAFRPEQRITCSSAGEHSQKIRDFRVDLQPRDGPIDFPGEPFYCALVKRFVILVLVQGLRCLSRSCAVADCAADDRDTRIATLKIMDESACAICASAHTARTRARFEGYQMFTDLSQWRVRCRNKAPDRSLNSATGGRPTTTLTNLLLDHH